MKEYIPIISATIAGLFAFFSAFIAWKLKVFSENQRNLDIRKKEKHEEIKALYITTFQLFEEAMGQVYRQSEFTLAQAFSENNAKIHLLAPQKIIDQYSEASALFENWSVLRTKANPRKMRVGNESVTMLQSPDPTAQFKEPAVAEYRKCQESLQKLTELMRSEIIDYA